MILAAGACAAVDPADSKPSNGASSTSADAALALFDRANPRCQMWTNWQRLCARTGPGGATYCKADAGFSAPPSAAFCASQQLAQGIPFDGRFDSNAQRRSRNRFCTAYADEQRPAGSDRPGQPMRRCAIYDAVRPFDGRRAEAIAHPLCRRWQTISPSPTAAPGALVGPASCVEWVERLPCPQVVGNANRFPAPDTIVMPTVQDVRRRPVWGVHCL